MLETWHALLWMCASKWDVLPEKQHQFYITSGDIPGTDTLACSAVASVSCGSNQVGHGWQGVTGRWQSCMVGWESFLARGRMLHKPQGL